MSLNVSAKNALTALPDLSWRRSFTGINVFVRGWEVNNHDSNVAE